MGPVCNNGDEDYKHIPLWGEGYSDRLLQETQEDRRIRELLKEENFEKNGERNKEITVKTGGMKFTLVRISPEDKENMERFIPYCEGSPEGKYGVIWRAGILEDRYVFDTREYAVEFIVMSRWWGEESL